MKKTTPTARTAGQQQWHLVTLSPDSRTDELLATAATGSTSPWYSGHFPGEPILPGIAQIEMVMETIQRAEGRQLCIAGLKRVRFKQVIQPEDIISIRVRPREGDADTYSFQVMVGGAVACSGVVVAAPAPDD